ncbi:Chromosome partition protein Smc [Carpediemonas membranifera]|uniref:Chromosome partition protein Smc n=1 Tax=Carpediemonas membranifera TaxID=201153 RepID=A0A8J6DXM5_9EUKA|nr:Chromosome partition protein Smc [Carpediemonas membranifera]|eukprot:KAG9390489.1 Chromosome partition protein Smc [Carpediemonas membranifera]
MRGVATSIQSASKNDALERRQKSKEKAAKWNNTISGLQKQRLADRQRRIEEEEERKRELDREMELLAMKEHAETIQRARDVINDQDDRIQAFKRASDVSKCLDTVGIQLAEKQARAKAEKEEDQRWATHLKAQEEAEKADDARKAEERCKAALELKKTRIEQLEEKRRGLDEEAAQDRMEGEIIAAEARQDEEAEIERVAEQRRRALVVNKENTQVWEDQARRKQADRAADAESLVMADELTVWGDHIEAAKKKSEQRYVDAAVARREQTYGKLARHLQEQTTSFERKLEVEEREAEEKFVNEEAAKKARQLEMQQMCDRQRRLQMKRAEEVAARERRIAESMKQNLDKNIAELRAAEKQELMDKYRQAKELSIHQRKEAVRQRAAKKNARAQEVQRYEAMAQAVAADEKEFIERYESDLLARRDKGENVDPLALALGKMKVKSQKLESTM